MSPNNIMKVLSLFDGISCAYVALQRAGVPIDKYTAYEIDKYAIEISKKNHPTIEHKGDVKDCKEKIEIDLLIGGSPCQDLSIAKKGRKGLEGDRSSLFWEYVRIKNLCQPKYFILENVASMSKKDKDTITKELGVDPIMIDASLVSAQSRKRLFWTNIPGVKLPDDKGIVVKDILEESVDDKYTVNKQLSIVDKDKRILGYINNSNSQGNRVYNINFKSACLTGLGGGLGAKTGLYMIGREVGRRIKDGKRADDDTTVEYKRFLEVRTDDKSGTLTQIQKDNLVIGKDVIRKLTPVECERLQTLPDFYTQGVSETQRLKCLGNAFCVSVVAHILSFLPA